MRGWMRPGFAVQRVSAVPACKNGSRGDAMIAPPRGNPCLHEPGTVRWFDPSTQHGADRTDARNSCGLCRYSVHGTERSEFSARRYSFRSTVTITRNPSSSNRTTAVRPANDLISRPVELAAVGPDGWCGSS
jgi:hypothetical protein